jgi:hypothetical protein
MSVGSEPVTTGGNGGTGDGGREPFHFPELPRNVAGLGALAVLGALFAFHKMDLNAFLALAVPVLGWMGVNVTTGQKKVGAVAQETKEIAAQGTGAATVAAIQAGQAADAVQAAAATAKGDGS